MSGTRRHLAILLLLPVYILFAAFTLDRSLIDIDYASDYFIYYNAFELSSVEPLTGFMQYTGWEPGFEIALWTFAATGLSFKAFAIAQAAFILATFQYLARSITKNTALSLIAVALFAIAPMYLSFVSIILRQSLSFSFLFLFLAAITEPNYRKAAVFGVLALSMHTSAAIFIFAALIALAVKRWDKTLTVSFLAMFALYAAGVSGALFSDLASYVYQFLFSRAELLSTDSYVTGTKLGFIVAVVLAYLPALYLQIRGQENAALRTTRRIAMILGIAFMASANLPYHDRIALAPFCLSPIFGVAFLRSIGRSAAAVAGRMPLARA